MVFGQENNRTGLRNIKMGLRTRSWIVGILVGSIVATAIVGYLHEANIFLEPTNPIIHLIL